MAGTGFDFISVIMVTATLLATPAEIYLVPLPLSLPSLEVAPRGLSLVHLALCCTGFPWAPTKQQQVAHGKYMEPIVRKKQGLWQSFCQAEEADFTMQMEIAAIFKEKLLTSFRQGKTRQKQAINLLFSPVKNSV